VIHPKERVRFEHGIDVADKQWNVVEPHPHPRPHPAAAAGQLAVVFSVASSNSSRSSILNRRPSSNSPSSSSSSSSGPMGPPSHRRTLGKRARACGRSCCSAAHACQGL
jgi:hypothetical protein